MEEEKLFSKLLVSPSSFILLMRYEQSLASPIRLKTLQYLGEYKTNVVGDLLVYGRLPKELLLFKVQFSNHPEPLQADAIFM